MPDYDCYSNFRFAGRVNNASSEPAALAEGKKKNKDVDEVREVPAAPGASVVPPTFIVDM